MLTPGTSGSAGNERERRQRAWNPIVLVLVVVLVLDFGLQLIGYERRANAQRPPFEKATAQPVCRATPGSAMLIYLLDGVTVGASSASRLLRFGASPYQVFEDEDDDEDEYD